MMLDDIKARCEEVGECWIWQGATGQTGYPIVKVAGQGCKLVRRLVLELRGVELKPRQPTVTTCNDKLCVCPEHVKATNPSSVGRAAAKRGAFSSPARGAKIAKARRAAADSKLTAEAAREIRESSESGPALARKYGVNRSRIQAIKSGKAWKDYTGNPFQGLMR